MHNNNIDPVLREMYTSIFKKNNNRKPASTPRKRANNPISARLVSARASGKNVPRNNKQRAIQARIRLNQGRGILGNKELVKLAFGKNARQIIMRELGKRSY